MSAAERRSRVHVGLHAKKPRTFHGFLEGIPFKNHLSSHGLFWYATCRQGNLYWANPKSHSSGGGRDCTGCDFITLKNCGVECKGAKVVFKRVKVGDWLVAVDDRLFRVVKSARHEGWLEAEEVKGDPETPLIKIREGLYRYRDCKIKCHGYYPPERRVVWEAVSLADDCVAAHGYSLASVVRQFDEIEGEVAFLRSQWLVENLTPSQRAFAR